MAFVYSSTKELDNNTSSPLGLNILADGSKLFYCGKNSSGNPSVIECALSTPWNIASLTITAALEVWANANPPQDIIFFPDGSGFLVAGYNSADKYGLSLYEATTLFSVAGASFVDKTTLSNTQEIRSVVFNADFSKMYCCKYSSIGYPEAIAQYNLSVPGIISTAVQVSAINYDVFDYNRVLSGRISDDGTAFYVLLEGTVGIKKLTLSTPWDLSSYTDDGYVWDDLEGENSLTESAIFLDSGADNLFILGNDNILGTAVAHYIAGEEPPPVTEFWQNFHGQTEIL
ncbi:MAG: hypothetical protein UU74_C0033G0027 [Candidatus Woesebacteria bacterium GW2011_GWA1_41_7]|uniref:Uncharacterized protein n=1 Tax=Candidatus Woesebacteria bacterium GW2011_GWA1_41_7 TaxID=1618556 RepID=A0A0G0WVQ2_9BACT|nr:MAG: hypothetical protein UU74_C0033G0027 [Candidatus Woesebacteria bacterium GW2011_GWA1_41_7]